MILFCGIHIPRIIIRNASYPQQSEELSSILTAMDECREILKEISRKWQTVNPHRHAYDKLSDEVKRLIEMTFQPAIDGQAINSSVVTGNEIGRGDPNYDFGDVLFNVSSWDDFMQEDIDMREVFGFDMNGYMANWTSEG